MDGWEGEEESAQLAEWEVGNNQLEFTVYRSDSIVALTQTDSRYPIGVHLSLHEKRSSSLLSATTKITDIRLCLKNND